MSLYHFNVATSVLYPSIRLGNGGHRMLRRFSSRNKPRRPVRVGLCSPVFVLVFAFPFAFLLAAVFVLLQQGSKARTSTRWDMHDIQETKLPQQLRQTRLINALAARKQRLWQDCDKRKATFAFQHGKTIDSG